MSQEEVKGYTKKIKKKAPKGAKKPKKGVTVRVNYTGREYPSRYRGA